MSELLRCHWPGDDPLMVEYHDREWGTPLRDDRLLFEFLTLEGAQAGLSWQTILKKREGYRRAFDGFDPVKIAQYDASDTARLLADKEIVRNRQKIAATIGNAQALLRLQVERSFSEFVWSYVGGIPVDNCRPPGDEPLATSAESQALSKELRQRGFRFVGPIICYAFMQAAGLVNDHLVTCFRYRELGGKECAH